MDFDKRLERAVERGHEARHARDRRAAEEAMTEEELRNLHSKSRLELSEHIETCLRKLVDHFPGFRFESIVSEEGWGARISRDDLVVKPGKKQKTYYSRLEMLIRPYSPAHIIELTTKGTIRNKEILSRTHYQSLARLDLDSFTELIDLWVLEFAEQYATRT